MVKLENVAILCADMVDFCILCFVSSFVYPCRHQKSNTVPTTVRTLRSLVMAKAPDHQISVSPQCTNDYIDLYILTL